MGIAPNINRQRVFQVRRDLKADGIISHFHLKAPRAVVVFCCVPHLSKDYLEMVP